MFSALSEKLTGVLKRLSSRGVLTEDQVKEGLREIRRILLEADVSYELTRTFVQRIRERAVGLEVARAVSPGQQLVKFVHDELVALLGEDRVPIAFATVPPTVVLLVGLQGSGKTTTAAKLAARLRKEQKAPYLIAADVYRPAAESQLRQLGQRVEVGVFGPSDAPAGTGVVELVRAGIGAAESDRARTVLVDTAGRLQIDDEMMAELRDLKAALSPQEVLLVADGMTGQDAVRIARGFNEALGVTGVVLTKLDGDARGGAALSIRGVTGAPIKYVGLGERLEALEPFDPVRIAGRILQKGDIVGLVERVQEAADPDASERLAKGVFSKKGLDLEDFLAALGQIQKLGPLKNVMGLLPGVDPKMLKNANVDERRMKRFEAIVLSMTPAERRRPEILNGSRRARIARGAGRTVPEVNQLLKQFAQMRKMLKSMGKLALH